MKDHIAKEIQQKFIIGSVTIMRDYTEIALMINACHLAIDRYSNMEEKIHLSTTANIPHPLRLQTEIEMTLENKDLIAKYSHDVQQQIFKQYITNSVTITDAIFEDVYEILLREYEPELIETQITNKIRSAWTQNNMINYFLEKTELQDTEKPNLRIKEAFDRYLEYRIIRHALIHNNGILSDKHIRQLDEIYDQTDEFSKTRSMKNSPFYADKEIKLDITIILGIRKYLYENMSYFSNALESNVIA